MSCEYSSGLPDLTDLIHTARRNVRMIPRTVSTDPKVWVTNDGRVINVADMATQHLINTVALLWRATALRSRSLASGDGSRKTMDGLTPNQVVPNVTFAHLSDEHVRLTMKAMMAEIARRDETK